MKIQYKDLRILTQIASTADRFVLVFATLLLSSIPSHAFLADVCDLKQKSLEESFLKNHQNLSKSDLKNYKENLAKECNLSERFLGLKQTLKSRFSVEIESLNEFQALRFVQRSWYDDAKSVNKPVEVIYQTKSQNYALPIEEQSMDIWDNWANGIKQINGVIAEVNKGTAFDLSFLKKVHRGLFPFYPLISEKGEYAWEPYPGVLKPTQDNESANYWWLVEGVDEIEKSKAIVAAENAMYQALGLETPAPQSAPGYVAKILDLRMTPDRSHPSVNAMGLFSGHGMMNRQNVILALDMVDQMFKLARAGKPMIWKNRIFSPAQLAYLIQQLYVRIHPFYEGNGRTSRFLQELILASFKLPPGSSGDLMDFDALTPAGEYYQLALQKNEELLNHVENCVNEFNSFTVNSKSIQSVDQKLISYDCRILTDRSEAWKKLARQNLSSSEFVDVDVIDDGVTKTKLMSREEAYQEAMKRVAESDQLSDLNHELILNQR